MNWLPKCGWITLTQEEALDFEFEQAGRWTWQIWRIEWFGRGISLMARAVVA
jgi:hypothetical protein